MVSIIKPDVYNYPRCMVFSIPQRDNSRVVIDSLKFDACCCQCYNVSYDTNGLSYLLGEDIITIRIPPGHYTSDDIINEINKQGLITLSKNNDIITTSEEIIPVDLPIQYKVNNFKEVKNKEYDKFVLEGSLWKCLGVRCNYKEPTNQLEIAYNPILPIVNEFNVLITTLDDVELLLNTNSLSKLHTPYTTLGSLVIGEDFNIDKNNLYVVVFSTNTRYPFKVIDGTLKVYYT